MAPDGTRRDDGRGLIELVSQVSKSFHRRGNEEMLGMRWKEFVVLSYLHEHPSATQQELGEAMFLDSNSVVLLLNELEARGFSVRRRDTGDRRRHVVEITPSGRDAVARGEKAREAIEDAVFAGLTADERQMLRRLLVRTLEGQARVAPAPSART